MASEQPFDLYSHVKDWAQWELSAHNYWNEWITLTLWIWWRGPGIATIGWEKKEEKKNEKGQVVLLDNLPSSISLSKHDTMHKLKIGTSQDFLRAT